MPILNFLRSVNSNDLRGGSGPSLGKKSGRVLEGDIGVCGIAVLANFSCGISVILILNCGIAVFSKPAGCVFLAFWSSIFGTKTYPSLFNEYF